MSLAFALMAMSRTSAGLELNDGLRRDAASGPAVRFIDNGVLRLGVNTNLGGAITYLAPSGARSNLINNYDWGRQIQLSYYSGPVPFEPPGKTASPQWRALGWNPIQTGDHFGNRSRVIGFSQDRTSLHVQCVPMIWPLDDVPGECTFEVWIRLEGSTAHVRCRLNNHRPDLAWYGPYSQECPAVYVNGPFHRLMTYVGGQPFTGAPLTRIEKDPRDGHPDFPWAHFTATENWAAQVNDEGFGLGVWMPTTASFLGGFAGKPGSGTSIDNPTGYIAPIQREILDPNITYDYEYVLILGTLDAIRDRVRQHSDTRAALTFDFARDRQHWGVDEARDQGWPMTEGWRITRGSASPARPLLSSPVRFWQADRLGTLRLRAAFQCPDTEVTVRWRRWDEPEFTPARQASLRVIPDGSPRNYELPLAGVAGYEGGLVQLQLLLPEMSHPAHHATLHSLALVPGGSRVQSGGQRD